MEKSDLVFDFFVSIDDKKNVRDALVSKNEKRANNLNGKDWLKYSISIWSDIRKTKEELNLNHPAIFPVELAGRLIDIFTNGTDKLVFDPFAGVGSTLIAAQQKGLKSVGIELNPEYVKIAEKRLSENNLFDKKEKNYIIYTSDARDIPLLLKPETVDLVITSPPYWNVLTEKRTADNKTTRKYSEENQDLGNIGDYNNFLNVRFSKFSLHPLESKAP